MRVYLDLLERVLDYGLVKPDRTGTGTRSVLGHQMRFDLGAGFPLLTTKKLHWRSIAGELIWFVRGGTNVGWLQERGVRIWNEWADEDGELGPIYGAQWRAWQGCGGETAGGETIDQLAGVIESIRENPHSRRHIVSAWNVAELPKMALPPCHLLFQLWVGDGTLSCLMFQRSADVFLGVPFNIASYALLTHLLARICGLEPGDLVIVLGDTHLYSNHVEQARLQLEREPRALPRLRLDPGIRALDDLTADDFDLERLAIEGYDPHPHIAAPIAV